jgi:hypothetical protein
MMSNTPPDACGTRKIWHNKIRFAIKASPQIESRTHNTLEDGLMDHVVYLDAGAEEMERLLSGAKTMIIRGATGRKMPYGRVKTGDRLYFLNNNAEGLIRVKAQVRSVTESDKMEADASVQFVREFQDKLQLTEKQFARWAGKRYIVLIEVDQVQEIPPFPIDKSSYDNMDDWLPIGNIDAVRL